MRSTSRTWTFRRIPPQLAGVDGTHCVTVIPAKAGISGRPAETSRPEVTVIPAKAGISARPAETSRPEIPAFAGMTNEVRQGACSALEGHRHPAVLLPARGIVLAAGRLVRRHRPGRSEALGAQPRCGDAALHQPLHHRLRPSLRQPLVIGGLADGVGMALDPDRAGAGLAGGRGDLLQDRDGVARIVALSKSKSTSPGSIT